MFKLVARVSKLSTALLVMLMHFIK